MSGSSDYLWTDKSLVTFIDEAQRRFAQRSFCLRDGTTDEVTKVTLVAGQAIYPLHPSIMSVISAKRQVRENDLVRVGHTLFTTLAGPNERYQDPASFNNYQPGETLAFGTDEAVNDVDSDSFEQISLRVYPRPAAAQAGDVIRLRVVREPISDLVPTALSAVPEIPRTHHIQMLDWAAYLALRIVDDDAGAPKRAAEFAASFESHVAEARKLAMRKLFAPTQWGFGRGGFSWGND